MNSTATFSISTVVAATAFATTMNTVVRRDIPMPTGQPDNNYDEQKWDNRDMATALNFYIIPSDLLTGEQLPCFLRKKAPFESAEPESTVMSKSFAQAKRVIASGF
ncbi:hypothetical protein GGF37_001290 [Kickxella alabastrina]|nr:hypothetical protein GGF37_001290 [Kickxella alabastrina]